MGVKITGLDKMQKQLKEVERATEALSGLNFWSVVIFQRCFERFLLRSQLVAGQHNLQLLFDCWPVIKETD
ncbi:Uncharacterised protein [Escherichia coli]|nr:Uncharacterised protein [Escherichia coli]